MEDWGTTTTTITTILPFPKVGYRVSGSRVSKVFGIGGSDAGNQGLGTRPYMVLMRILV